MDIDDFSDPQFDPKIWLNRTIKSSANKTDAKLTAVQKNIVKLQAYFQQINSDLKQSTVTIMQGLPRILHDIDTIGVEAITLKENMNIFKEEISNVENGTITELEKVDKIRSLLVEGKQALYEADNWTVLSTDIENVFETGDIDLIASKLISMQQSLNVLSNSSDFENKKFQLEGLKNRLEALTSPLMVEAFSKLSIDQSKRFVRIFQDIDRLPQLVKYYTKCQKASLIQKWQSIVEENEDNVLISFELFYELLFTTWQDQYRFCQEVLPTLNTNEVLQDLYTDLLNTLGKEFKIVLENHLKENPEPVRALQQIKQTVQKFLNTLKPKLDKDRCQPIAKAVYMPLVQRITKLEYLFLLNKNEDFEVHSCNQENHKILIQIKNNFQLCLQLSEGCTLPNFFKQVSIFLKLYLAQYQSFLVKLKDSLKEVTEDFNLFQTFVSILQNLGDLLFEIKQLDLDFVQTLLTIDEGFKKSDLHPFDNYLDLLIPLENAKEFLKLVSNLSGESELSVLKIEQNFENVAKYAYQQSFNVIFSPISNLLEPLATSTVWKNKSASGDLPDYSFTPQEYITQIGQYVMNLPQLLEPFMSHDNPSLNLALSLVSVDFIHLTDPQTESSSFAEVFLNKITDSACQSFAEHILSIDELSTYGCKQLIMDINYFGNVLEDLGFTMSEKLKKIAILLKLEPGEFSSGCPDVTPKIVATIRQMRNVISD